MTYDDFTTLLKSSATPVVLLEGTRALPPAEYPMLVTFAAALARRFPHALFRTGNAPGTDAAFAEGVWQVNPAALEYVLPYARHREQYAQPGAYSVALPDVPHAAEAQAAYLTAKASPAYRGVMANRARVPRLQAHARYLLRDTIKVTGEPSCRLAPATVGVFRVNPVKPMGGGTGHTIRVCQKQAVPVILQDEWQRWGLQ